MEKCKLYSCYACMAVALVVKDKFRVMCYSREILKYVFVFKYFSLGEK